MVTMKILLGVLNGIFLACGIVLLTVGVLFLVNPTFLAYLDIADLSGDGDLTQNVAITMIAIGSIMTIICFFGAFGACCGNRCMLMSYCIFIGITACVQIAFGIFMLVEDDWLDDQLESGMNDFIKYGYDGQDPISESWDRTQMELQCCGVRGPEDYINSKWYNETGDTEGWLYPKTCCVLNNDDPTDPQPEDPVACQAGDTDHLYDKGCYDDLSDWLLLWNTAIAGSIMVYAILQTGMIFFACCLMSMIKSQNKVDTITNPKYSATNLQLV